MGLISPTHTSYRLSIPQEIITKAEIYAHKKGVLLDQFFLSAIQEKVEPLIRSLDEKSQITYRKGGSGTAAPILNGTNVRVQTIVVANTNWGWADEKIADEFDLNDSQVRAALVFYNNNKKLIDDSLALEQSLEPSNV